MNHATPPTRLRLRPEPPVTIPATWLRAAARLPGKSLTVGVVLWAQAAVERSTSFAIQPARLRAHGVAPDAAYDGLARLAAARLIAVQRGRGRPARVLLLDGRGVAVADPAGLRLVPGHEKGLASQP